MRTRLALRDQGFEHRVGVLMQKRSYFNACQCTFRIVAMRRKLAAGSFQFAYGIRFLFACFITHVSAIFYHTSAHSCGNVIAHHRERIRATRSRAQGHHIQQRHAYKPRGIGYRNAMRSFLTRCVLHTHAPTAHGAPAAHSRDAKVTFFPLEKLPQKFFHHETHREKTADRSQNPARLECACQ